ncbi:hypothetical protein [Leptospira brenneri]|uniref:hypothetical protein n=1 Tax=Leptospira brenneri TaxID=2023182 RepID=UPI000C2A9B2B|nr:hypothetical protein [Leptospira brenneri]PJZ47068.1 hypothetical protein CH361_01600 [Leptospira brenneri]
MNKSIIKNCFQLIYLLMVVYCFSFSLSADPKDPPSSISFVEGGVKKTFYRNPNVEAEFVEPGQAKESQEKNQGKQGVKSGWNIRPSGKQLFSKSNKSTNTKVTEVYSTSVGSGPSIVLPGILIVTFSSDQSRESLERISKKYGVQLQNQFSPRLASFQTEPGFLSVEKANELLSESNVLEAYPDTAVEKSLK